jgi:hypothetical protein
MWRIGVARAARSWWLGCALVALFAACGGSSSGNGDCLGGRTRCGDVCVDTGSDPSNCGGCGDACAAATPLCQAGVCVTACSPGQTECQGGCVDVTTDPFHCGACGNVCTLDLPICEAGECVAFGGTVDAGVTPADAGGAVDAPPGCPNPVAPGGACPQACTGGCDGNVCTIDCTGAGAPCDGADIVCPPEFDCVVLCNGVDACDSGTITCPPDYGCTVTCGGGNDACGDQVITCGDGACSVSCEADSCQGATVECGLGPCTATCGGPPQPAVNCGSSCACTGC